MQYYAQYYQYPQQIVTPTHEVKESPVEDIKVMEKEETIEKKEFALSKINYELPKLPPKWQLVTTSTNSQIL